jgi:hypothetical protein
VDAPRLVYQVINFSREELFFGTTELDLEREVERLSRDTQGPTAGWKRGEVVSWRPLTEKIDPLMARTLHKQFEAKPPPNRFKVLATFEA